VRACASRKRSTAIGCTSPIQPSSISSRCSPSSVSNNDAPSAVLRHS